jgi:hypothetical protein
LGTLRTSVNKIFFSIFFLIWNFYKLYIFIQWIFSANIVMCTYWRSVISFFSKYQKELRKNWGQKLFPWILRQYIIYTVSVYTSKRLKNQFAKLKYIYWEKIFVFLNIFIFNDLFLPTYSRKQMSYFRVRSLEWSLTNNCVLIYGRREKFLNCWQGIICPIHRRKSTGFFSEIIWERIRCLEDKMNKIKNQ